MGRSPLLGAPPLPSPSAPSPPQPGWGTWASLPGILAQPRSPGHDAGIEGVPYSKANKLRFAATDLLVVTPRRHLTKMVFAAVRVRQCSGSCSPAFQPAWRALVRQWPCMLPTAEPADQGLRSGDRRVRCPVGRLCRDWCPVHDSGTADGGGGEGGERVAVGGAPCMAGAGGCEGKQEGQNPNGVARCRGVLVPTCLQPSGPSLGLMHPHPLLLRCHCSRLTTFGA